MPKPPALALLAACLLLPACNTMRSNAPTDDLTAETDTWHAQRLARLAAPDGWLSLVGLEWLESGPNTVGRADDAQIRYAGFPADRVGAITVTGDAITFAPAGGIDIQGLPQDRRLRTDADGSPTILSLGDIRFYVIIRGGKPAVRIKDAAAPTRTGFGGIERFPVDPAWRLEAEFVPEPRTTQVDTIINTREEATIIGRARFELHGAKVDAALYEGDATSCYLRFADATSGDTTYPVGRYLVIDLPPDDGKLTLDFNRAYSPPCAFTPFATCDIPLESNRFPFAVTAGERWSGGH